MSTRVTAAEHEQTQGRERVVRRRATAAEHGQVQRWRVRRAPTMVNAQSRTWYGKCLIGMRCPTSEYVSQAQQAVVLFIPIIDKKLQALGWYQFSVYSFRSRLVELSRLVVPLPVR